MYIYRPGKANKKALHPFTPPIHTYHSQLSFTPPIHTSHSHLTFTHPIHTRLAGGSIPRHAGRTQAAAGRGAEQALHLHDGGRVGTRQAHSQLPGECTYFSLYI